MADMMSMMTPAAAAPAPKRATKKKATKKKATKKKAAPEEGGEEDDHEEEGRPRRRRRRRRRPRRRQQRRRPRRRQQRRRPRRRQRRRRPRRRRRSRRPPRRGRQRRRRPRRRPPPRRGRPPRRRPRSNSSVAASPHSEDAGDKTGDALRVACFHSWARAVRAREAARLANAYPAGDRLGFGGRGAGARLRRGLCALGLRLDRDRRAAFLPAARFAFASVRREIARDAQRLAHLDAAARREVVPPAQVLRRHRVPRCDARQACRRGSRGNRTSGPAELS